MPLEKSNAATKSDLKAVQSLLTSEIKNVEAKLTSDIKTVETKLTSDIKAVESRLSSDIRTLAKEIVRTQASAAQSEERLSRKLEEGFSRVVGIVQDVAGKLRDLQRTVDDIFKSHRERLDGHETRLKALEAK